VEAEQDPKKANPLKFAKIGYKYLNRILTEEFINTNSDMCICGINLYRNIYYICSNNPLKNYINYHFFPKILIEQHTIPREYDPYSLIVSPVIKWGKFQCMRTHI